MDQKMKYLFLGLVFIFFSGGPVWAQNLRARSIPSYMGPPPITHAAFGRLDATKKHCIYNPRKMQKKCLPRHRSG